VNARTALCVAALALLPTTVRANGRFPATNQLVSAPGDPTHLALRATYGLLLSSDAGRTWDWVCEKPLGYGGAEDPSIVLTGGGAIVVGTFQGITRSTDGGCTWQKDPAWPRNVVDLALRRAAPHSVVAASCAYARPGDAGASLFDATIHISDDDGATWRTVATLDPSLLVDSLEVSESDPRILYVSAIRARGKDTTAALLVSHDGGATFREHPVPFSQSDRGVYIAAVDPVRPGRVYLRVTGVDTGRLVVTDDEGATLRELVRGGTLSAFALADGGKTIYVGGPKDGLLALADDGAPPVKRTSAPVQCLASIGAELWACGPQSGGYVLGASSDRGASFEPRLTIGGMRGPLECPEETIARTCAAPWSELRNLVGWRPRPAAVAAPPGERDASHRACGCGLPGRSRGGAPWPLALATLLLGTVLRRLRQEPSEDMVRS
jgi:photosystem II stability/assembly factor-like uncharacterized protein